MGVGLVVSLISAEMLVEKRLVGSAITFGVAVLLFGVGVIVVARAGTPEERKTRQAQIDRWGAAIGMAMGKASGGWTPRRDERKPSQRRNRSD
jgi:hypothetical protein